MSRLHEHRSLVAVRVWSATYLPFGYETNPQSTANHYKFTGKERDSETGLDYFGARYYGSTMGRFTSPDEFTGGPVEVYGGAPTPPGPLPYATITNPQSLNKYSYTYNNPLRYTDPNGHCVEVATCTLQGAAIGSAFGPAGTVIGGIVAGGLGLYVGYKIGQSIDTALQSNDASDTSKPGTGATSAIPYPGNDPTVPPGEGWVWKGKGTPESGEGSWVNPKTGESLHPDLDSKTHGPHWDYQKGKGKENAHRMYPDGQVEPKIKPKPAPPPPPKPPKPEED